MKNYKNEIESKAARELKRFLEGERGAVLLEYVVLLMGCFITIYAAIEPFKNAFLTYLTGMYEGLTLP